MKFSQSCLDDALRPLLKWSGFAHDTSNSCKPWLMLYVVCQCFFLDAHMQYPCSVPWLISRTFGQHLLHDIHIFHSCVPASMKPHAICGLLVWNSHMQGQMYVVLHLCFLSLADIYISICVGYRWFWQVYPMPVDWYVQATNDAGRKHPMSTYKFI